MSRIAKYGFSALLLILIGIGLSGCSYTWRVVSNIDWSKMDASALDFGDLPSVPLHPSPTPIPISNASNDVNLSSFVFTPEYGDGDMGTPVAIDQLDQWLADHATSAFLVLHKGEVIYERHFQAPEEVPMHKAFSMTKSFLSLLIGISIERGEIKSVDDLVIEYVPEIDQEGSEGLTIRHLLMNMAGFAYPRGLTPWNIRTRMYYTYDVRNVLEGADFNRQPGLIFVPEELSPLLLNWILERATGKKFIDILQERLWNPMGMQYPAIANIDSVESDFAKVESGLVAHVRDLAKLGLLVNNQGRVGSNQLVPSHWMQESTLGGSDAYNKVQHKYLWWNLERENEVFDIFANGHHGQRIYASPSDDIVVVRMGIYSGGVHWNYSIRDMVVGFRKALG